MGEIRNTREYRSAIAAEQDKAAGGRDARRVSFPDGKSATASVSLSNLGGAAYRASLRFKHASRTYRRPIGLIDAGSREEALRKAWQQVELLGLLVE